MITSIQNETIKKYKKLAKRRERNKQRAFLIEGEHLVEEAYKSGWEIIDLLVTIETEIPSALQSLKMTYVTDEIMHHLAETVTPQGMIAIVRMQELNTTMGNKIILIDGVQDPGNLGTIIRTADALGFNRIVLGEGTVDLYNAKVIRATQGSLFHVSVVERSLMDEIIIRQGEGFIVWATSLEGAVMLDDAEIPGKLAIVLGNEGAGVRDEILNASDKRVIIPIVGQAESLNVAIAAGILMYQTK